MAHAIVFDLDETLLDTSALRTSRLRQSWQEVAERLGEVRPYDIRGSTIAVEELPGRLRADGYRVGVLTQSPRWYATELLDAFSISSDALITGSDPYPAKPDPSSLRAIADELGADPTEVIFVGDAPVDFGAAASAHALSVGVCWSRRAPREWRREWPDTAITRPERLFDVLADADSMRPLGEALVEGSRPLWHWGTTLRLDQGVYATGRYFSTTDDRHSRHRLSQLVLEAKDEPQAAEDVAEILAGWAARRADRGDTFDVVTSVPPRPDATYDRFEVPRQRVAEAFGARDEPAALAMRFAVDDYKTLDHDTRAAVNAQRFEAAALRDGERVLVLDDVLTSGSGGQAQTCATTLLQAGASQVTVLGLCATQETLPRGCPVCGGLLRTINGRNGLFVGCSNYWHTGCRYTEDV